MITKQDTLDIINAYQNHFNDFVNISQNDLDQIYLNSAKNYITRLTNKTK